MVISSKVIGIIAVIIIAVAAVTAWQIYPTLNHPTNNPTPTPTPNPTQNPTATPTPAPTATAKPTTKPTSHSSSSSSSTNQQTPTPTPEPPVLWNLNFAGGNSVNMTNNAFENLATTQSLTYAQNDTNSNTTWTGIPLYKLVNYYADNGYISYGVLSLGYNVTVIAASDGYSKTFNSTRIADNQNIILANTGNGTTFTDLRYYPLTLTGSNLTKQECVKLVSQIRIDTLLPANMTLTLKAVNGTTITFNRDQIAALPTVSGMAGRSTHGSIQAIGNYTGISVLYLANLVGGLPDNTYRIDVKATDGKATSLYYSQVVNGTGYTTTYNQTTNAEQAATLPIIPILAYSCNGNMLKYNYYDNGTISQSGTEGPLRLAFIGPEGLLTGSSDWAKWVVEVDVVSN